MFPLTIEQKCKRDIKMRDLTPEEIDQVGGGMSTGTGAGLELALIPIALLAGAPILATMALGAAVIIIGIDIASS